MPTEILQTAIRAMPTAALMGETPEATEMATGEAM